MDSIRQKAAPRVTPHRWLAWPTAVFPGLGPLLRGELSLAAVFVMAHLWLRLMLAGMASPAERIDGFFLGAFGATGGLKNPTFVFVTLLVLAIHALAVVAWMRPRRSAKTA